MEWESVNVLQSVLREGSDRTFLGGCQFVIEKSNGPWVTEIFQEAEYCWRPLKRMIV